MTPEELRRYAATVVARSKPLTQDERSAVAALMPRVRHTRVSQGRAA